MKVEKKGVTKMRMNGIIEKLNFFFLSTLKSLLPKMPTKKKKKKRKQEKKHSEMTKSKVE